MARDIFYLSKKSSEEMNDMLDQVIRDARHLDSIPSDWDDGDLTDENYHFSEKAIIDRFKSSLNANFHINFTTLEDKE